MLIAMHRENIKGIDQKYMVRVKSTEDSTLESNKSKQQPLHTTWLGSGNMTGVVRVLRKEQSQTEKI